MPRGRRVLAKIFVKTTPPRLLTRPSKPHDGDGPRLWNAKRRIKNSKGVPFQEAKIPYDWIKKDILSSLPQWESRIFNEKVNGEWWKLDTKSLRAFMEEHPILKTISQDVKDFIAKGSINLTRPTISQLLRSPSAYFSKPENVPLSIRKQVFFPKPEDAVTLMRTSHLGPRYAAFDVPLHFNKLDLKAYLKDVYNVDVLHIRSAVIQHKLERREGRDKYSQGALFRPKSEKKMTCLLAKPFVYPEEPENLDLWQHNEFWTSMKALTEQQREEGEWGQHNPNLKNRKAVARQAQQLLAGKTRWGPTWQNFESEWRVMQPGAGETADDQGSQPRA